MSTAWWTVWDAVFLWACARLFYLSLRALIPDNEEDL